MGFYNILLFKLIYRLIYFVVYYLFFQGDHGKFAINLQHRNRLVQFDPQFAKFEEEILKVYTQMIKAVSKIPRLEYLIYMDYYDDQDEIKFLKVYRFSSYLPII